MSAQLESERGRLATAQQESEQAAAKLEAAQAQITNQAAEFSARDAARSEQVPPANFFLYRKSVPENLFFFSKIVKIITFELKFIKFISNIWWTAPKSALQDGFSIFFDFRPVNLRNSRSPDSEFQKIHKKFESLTRFGEFLIIRIGCTFRVNKIFLRKHRGRKKSTSGQWDTKKN